MGDHPQVLAQPSVVTRLLTDRVRAAPTAAFAICPGGVRVSFCEFAHAVTRFARAVQCHVPRPRTHTVGLLVHCDTLLYATAIAGTIAGGCAVFPISHRNSAEGIVHLLRATAAEVLFVTAAHLAPLVADVKALLAQEAPARPLRIEELPSFSEIYPRFGEERRSCEGDVEMYLHSSGSTGLPKPIPYSSAFIASHANFTWVAEVIKRGKPLVLGGLSLPTFHAMGVLFHVLYPLLTGYPTAMYTPQAPAPPIVTAPDVALRALKDVGANIVLVAPAFLEAWVRDQAAMEFLKTAEVVSFGGGPLAAAASHRLIAAGCTVSSVYGGTEFGPVTRMFPTIPRPEDDPYALDWCEFGPEIIVRWREDGDGAFELELLRSEAHLLAVENLPDVRGYATRDLWVPHATIDGLWRIVGRVDDVIMLSTGEKIVPGATERAALAHPGVAAAIVFGRGRAQAGLLLTLHPGAEVQDVWPAVAAANAGAPAFAHVHEEMLLCADPARPLPLTPKGTIMRKAALALYAPDIERLYDDLAHGRSTRTVELPQSWEADNICSWLLRLAAGISGHAVAPDVCLFDQGFDSLSATRLRHKIVAAVRASAAPARTQALDAIAGDIAYATTSPTVLARALAELVRNGATTLRRTTVADIRTLVEKYSAPTVSPRPRTRPSGGKRTIVITGTTGGLGSHLLERFLRDPKVERVYALNRSPAGRSLADKQREAFESRHLDAEVLSSSKLTFVESKTGEPQLGLDEETWEHLRCCATTVVQNAWHLDFNLPLLAFESHIHATRELLDLAGSAERGARFIFVSSVSVARGWPDPYTPVPEADLEPALCLGLGYSESKYVGAQLVKRRREAGLDAITVRVGQIAGSEGSGAWSTTDWVPIIVKTAVALGSLPSTDGVVSWLPVDTVTQLLMDIVGCDELPAPVVNVVHPHPVTWDALVSQISDALVETGVSQERLPLVPFPKWLARLDKATAEAESARLEVMPAIKLRDFLQRMAAPSGQEADSLPRFSMAVAQSVCPAMDALSRLGPQNARRWVHYWDAQGFFDDAKALQRA